MNQFHLSQVNIAQRLASFDDPIMQGFIDNLNILNAIPDVSEGFVWRLKDEDKDESFSIFKDDSLIINMSVWEDLNSLYNYTYKSNHIQVVKRKKEWFSKIKMKHMAFWYVSKGYQSTISDAKKRLDYLIQHGETPFAFTFKSKFSITDSLTYKQLILP